jgi:hypothetical protein
MAYLPERHSRCLPDILYRLKRTVGVPATKHRRFRLVRGVKPKKVFVSIVPSIKIPLIFPSPFIAASLPTASNPC